MLTPIYPCVTGLVMAQVSLGLHPLLVPYWILWVLTCAPYTLNYLMNEHKKLDLIKENCGILTRKNKLTYKKYLTTKMLEI